MATLAEPGGILCGPLACRRPQENSPSGISRTLGKRVGCKPSGGPTRAGSDALRSNVAAAPWGVESPVAMKMPQGFSSQGAPAALPTSGEAPMILRPAKAPRVIPVGFSMACSPMATVQARRIRLVAYGARLESVLGASPRGFESPILRRFHVLIRSRQFHPRAPVIWPQMGDVADQNRRPFQLRSANSAVTYSR